MGTITVASTGAWADGATVSINGPTSRSMYVDGTGFYAFIDLPPGSYTVTASKAGYPNVAAPVSVAVGAVTGNMYQQDFVSGCEHPAHDHHPTAQPGGEHGRRFHLHWFSQWVDTTLLPVAVVWHEPVWGDRNKPGFGLASTPIKAAPTRSWLPTRTAPPPAWWQP